MGAAPYGAQAKGADAPARRLRDIRRVHSWAHRYNAPMPYRPYFLSRPNAARATRASLVVYVAILAALST